MFAAIRCFYRVVSLWLSRRPPPPPKLLLRDVA
jgi:hypothetical protein